MRTLVALAATTIFAALLALHYQFETHRSEAKIYVQKQEWPGVKPQARHAEFLDRGPRTHPPTSWPIRDLLFVSYLQVAARRIATARARGTARRRGGGEMLASPCLLRGEGRSRRCHGRTRASRRDERTAKARVAGPAPLRSARGAHRGTVTGAARARARAGPTSKHSVHPAISKSGPRAPPTHLVVRFESFVRGLLVLQVTLLKHNAGLNPLQFLQTRSLRDQGRSSALWRFSTMRTATRV